MTDKGVEHTEHLWIAGSCCGDEVEILGLVTAEDVAVAEQSARHRWGPGAGVCRWRRATRELQAAARRTHARSAVRALQRVMGGQG